MKSLVTESGYLWPEEQETLETDFDVYCQELRWASIEVWMVVRECCPLRREIGSGCIPK